MKYKVVFEDNDILVLNKPSGITVNKSETTKGVETIQDFLEKEVLKDSLINPDDSDFYKRSGIVHRLDKETSGILITAKNKNAFENLQSQFKERIVKKVYIALVHGRVEPEEGEIKVPVGRLPWNRKRFGVLAGGREALTRFKVISFYKSKKEELSLIEAYPETGRTHQIRVHMKYFNHPIFSDYIYAGRKTSRDDRISLPRVFLHANKIEFNHPVTNEKIRLEAPLAPELENFLATLEKRS